MDKRYIQYLQVFKPNSNKSQTNFGLSKEGENESQQQVRIADVFFTTVSE